MNMHFWRKAPEIRAVSVACPSADTLGLDPVWIPREQALYWLDVRNSKLHRLIPGKSAHQNWTMHPPIVSIAPSPHGIIFATEKSLCHFCPDTEKRTVFLELESFVTGQRMTALRCDGRGRLLVATTNDVAGEGSGYLLSVDADFRFTCLLSNLRSSSSIDWRPNPHRLYVRETDQNHVQCYDYNISDGSVRRRSQPAGAEPNWLQCFAVDTENCLWSAQLQPGQVTRFSPEGEILSVIALPASQVTACAFGGPGLRTLFVTSASEGLSQTELSSQSEAGHLFAVKVGIPGRPETTPAFLQNLEPILSTGGWPDTELPIY